MRLIRGSELRSMAEYVFDGGHYVVNDRYVALSAERLYVESAGGLREQSMRNAVGESFLSPKLNYYIIGHSRVRMPDDTLFVVTATPERANSGLDVTTIYLPSVQGVVEIGTTVRTPSVVRLEGKPELLAVYIFDVFEPGDAVRVNMAVANEAAMELAYA